MASIEKLMERVNEIRYEALWLVSSWGSTPESIRAVDTAMVIDCRIEDSERWPRRFTFAGLVGVIDEDDFVCWGNMGLHLECIGNPLFRKAIHDQTGRRV